MWRMQIAPILRAAMSVLVPLGIVEMVWSIARVNPCKSTHTLYVLVQANYASM